MGPASTITLFEKTMVNGLEAHPAFKCNQFGHQTNENNDEFLNTLKFVRPGNNFEPKATIFEKTDVNGADAAPLFKWLKSELRAPSDEEFVDTKGNGVADPDALVLPRGAALKRYSRFFDTNAIATDIDALL